MYIQANLKYVNKYERHNYNRMSRVQISPYNVISRDLARKKYSREGLIKLLNYVSKPVSSIRMGDEYHTKFIQEELSVHCDN